MTMDFLTLAGGVVGIALGAALFWLGRRYERDLWLDGLADEIRSGAFRRWLEEHDN